MSNFTKQINHLTKEQKRQVNEYTTNINSTLNKLSIRHSLHKKLKLHYSGYPQHALMDALSIIDTGELFKEKNVSGYSFRTHRGNDGEVIIFVNGWLVYTGTEKYIRSYLRKLKYVSENQKLKYEIINR